MPARFYIDAPLIAPANPADPLRLPSGPARHVQVLRMQPGDALTLFDGSGGEWAAQVVRMGRSDVDVQLAAHDPVDRELGQHITIALGMPANERMDALVEKATELGVARIQPLVCERSVLRLSGERAIKKVAHWQGVAVAACEQSGRTRVPVIAPIRSLAEWLASLSEVGDVADAPAATAHERRWVMSLRDAGTAPPQASDASLVCLSGPEGGLSEAEERAAFAKGFAPVSLGPRVLRADTAPVALLAYLAIGRNFKA